MITTYYIVAHCFTKGELNRMSVSISIRIPESMANLLDEVAKETERSKSYLIQKAIQQFLEDQADLQIALDRLHDTSDHIISVNEMRNEFGL